MKNPIKIGIVLLSFTLLTSSARAEQFLQVTSLVGGVQGEFTGTLAGVTVTGTASSGDGSYSFINGGTTNGNINDTTDFGNSGIFRPSIAETSSIAYSSGPSTSGTLIQITFSQAMTNVVFQIANLDRAQYQFSNFGGLTGEVILSGNGDGNGGARDQDGLGLLFKNNGVIAVVDQNPSTVNEGGTPSSSGARSAYGSVELVGTYTTIFLDVTNATTLTDGGNFTLSTAPDAAAAVPEPASIVMTSMAALAGLGVFARRRIAARKLAATS